MTCTLTLFTQDNNMTYDEIDNIFKAPFLNPWENDYYSVSFDGTMTRQEFLEYAYEKIADLNGLWYEISGSTVYFIVPTGTVIPDEFGVNILKAENVPTEPEESTE